MAHLMQKYEVSTSSSLCLHGFSSILNIGFYRAAWNADTV